MPSFLQRARRGSDNVFSPSSPVTHEEQHAAASGTSTAIPASPSRVKRLSLDASNHPDSASPTGRSRLKSIFTHKSSNSQDEGRMDSLRKKLTSPSTLFQKPSTANGNGNGDVEAVRPMTPPSPNRDLLDLDSPNGSPANQDGRLSSERDNQARMDRYNNPSPRTPSTSNRRTSISTPGQFASPTLFPENFSLSRTRSPEHGLVDGGAAGSVLGGKKRDSWIPSYPLVVPDGQYADIAPDGLAPPSAQLASPVSAVNENARRRSVDLSGLQQPKPVEGDLSAWPAMQAVPVAEVEVAKKAVRPGSKLENGLWTPPSSAEAIPVRLGQHDGNGDAVGPATESAPVQPMASAAGPAAAKDDAAPSYSTETSPASGSPGPLALLMTSAPASSSNSPISSPIQRGLTATRPSGPSRRTTHITSPPMPQPIKNLPTLTNLPGFAQGSSSAASTPGWGALGREGGARTPGGFVFSSGPRTPGAMMYGQSPRTPGPGSGGFPFATGSQGGKGKAKGPMAEEELRKMRRAMVSRTTCGQANVSACDAARTVVQTCTSGG
jgi:hypothetical protein